MKLFFRYSLLALGLFVVGAGFLLYLAFIRVPSNSLDAFVNQGCQTTGARLVVSAGGSTTHASLSADYVSMLRQRLDGNGYLFVNAGRNGSTSSDLLQRLDRIVACQPHIVTILIGTNDLLDGASIELFRENLETIVTSLRTKTEAEIALLSLPPLGEASESEINQQVDLYNDIIKQVAAAQEITYLPLNEALHTLIKEHTGEDQEVKPYALRVDLLLMAAVRHYIGRQSWDEIAAANGFVVSTDQIHLNDRGAAQIVDLIADWLQHREAISSGQ